MADYCYIGGSDVLVYLESLYVKNISDQWDEVKILVIKPDVQSLGHPHDAMREPIPTRFPPASTVIIVVHELPLL